MVGSIINDYGKKVFLYRRYTENGDLSATQYLPDTRFKVGIDNTDPSVTNDDLDLAIPISDGTTNDDGSNTFNRK